MSCAAPSRRREAWRLSSTDRATMQQPQHTAHSSTWLGREGAVRASEQRAVVQRPTLEAPACASRVIVLCQTQGRFCITISSKVMFMTTGALLSAWHVAAWQWQCIDRAWLESYCEHSVMCVVRWVPRTSCATPSRAQTATATSAAQSRTGAPAVNRCCVFATCECTHQD